jgi:hypothetical protein
VLASVILLYYPYYLKPRFEKEIIEEAQRNSQKVAEHFINDQLAEILNYDPSIFQRIEEDIERDINTFDLWKVRLFSPDGNIIYSSKKSEIGDVNKRTYFRQIVAKGQLYTKTVEKGHMTESGTLAPYDVVETYVPIMVEGKFMGAYEIYLNVTEQMGRLKNLFWRSYGVSIPIIVFLVSLVLYSSLKIDASTKERERIIAELQGALSEIRTLRGIVPICASCKQIRDDEGFWHQVESYIADRTEAEFSHGICPKCMKELYPDFVKDKEGDNKCSS